MPNPRARGGSPKSRARTSRSANRPVLGIDLGGTKVTAALVDDAGTVLHHSGRHVHANDGPGGVIEIVARAARSCLEKAGELPKAAGIAVAAQVEPRTGTVVHAPNLGWRDVALGRRLGDVLGIPVHVVNDARAATYAEWTWGAGKGETDLFCLCVGTGIGGSAVVGGHLLEGGSNAAGEVGHVPIVSGGRRCHCPSWGCFEAYAGGWAIAERAREAIVADSGGGAALLGLARSLEAVTAQTVFRAYRAGDPMAHRLVRETERYLADGAVGVVNAFNPAVLILSGGVVTGLPECVSSVETAVRARCQPPAAGARVVAARFGEDSALIGAAAMVRRVQHHPRALK